MEDEAVKAAADWWARGLGIAALTASLGALAWNMYNAILRDRAKLVIEVSLSVVGWGTRTMTCVSVEVFNVGRRPNSVAGCIFRISKNRNLTFVPGLALKDPLLGSLIDESHKMPKRLEESQSHKFYYPESALRESLAEDPSFALERAVIRDGANRRWSKRVPKTIREYFDAAKTVDQDSDAEVK